MSTAHVEEHEFDDLSDLTSLARDLFAPRGELEDREPAAVVLDRPLWDSLDAAGLARLTESEDRGGSGAGLREAAVVLNAAGGSAARVPIAEDDLLARWLTRTAGIAVDGQATRTAAQFDAGGRARYVPWSQQVERITALWNRGSEENADWFVVDVDRADFTLVDAGTNLAGEPRDTLLIGDLDSRGGVAVDEQVAEEFLLRGALARSILIGGALDRAVELCIDYTAVREQFGRPLSRFQAVQSLVADAAAEAALVHAATDAAVAVVERDGFTGQRAKFAVAVAKSAAGNGATVVARNAHQSFGAIGFTYEHELHRHTNRMLSWRSEFGSVQRWNDYLTETVLNAGSSGVWSLIAD